VVTRVVLYSYASGAPSRVAEFRWSAADGVTLDIDDPEWGSVAEQYLADGVYSHDEDRRVEASDGEAFMRALVQSDQSTYVRFVDESEPGPDDEPPGRGGYTPLQAYRVLAGLPVDDEPPAPPGPPLARTNDEAQLYMDLHPCERCGSVHTQWKTGADGVAVRVYYGSCEKCGYDRRFEFRQPEVENVRVAGKLVDFGGPEQSELLDPGEWLWVADLTAGRVPVGQPAAARHALSVAVGAIEEILKFVPAGAARVPAEAFRTAKGLDVYAAEPGRFERERLEIVRDTYRDALARLPHPDAG
jgi:hypothetical protein